MPKKGETMKKIILSLFLIATSMGVTRLSAYCVYNYSNEKIYVNIYKKWPGMFSRTQAYYELKPDGKKCWNWREIDRKNRKREYYWIASSNRNLGKGYFPIGGAIVFEGYERGKAKFNIYYDSKLWKYKESPWNHKKQPWETYRKR